MKKYFHLLLVFTCCIIACDAIAQSNVWTWMKGDNLPGQIGNYGVKGIPAASNKPGARYETCQWTDLQGNFWLYGGGSGMTRYSDLWKFEPATNNWTWIHGSQVFNQTPVYGTKGIADPANSPGGIGFGVASWTDLQGNLWMYGGDDAVNGSHNALWKYNTATNEWTWMQGDSAAGVPPVYGTRGISSPLNTPGARCETSCTWTDNNGDLWLFGGTPNGAGTCYNDLWKYSIVTNEWTWISGDNTPNQIGVYGTRGVSAPANKPGGRWCYTSWKDNSGNLWLFGGIDATSVIGMSYFNDLWKYDVSINEWTWMSGSSTVNQAGIFGAKCTSSTLTSPGARGEARACWKDECNNFWLFGGRDQNFDLYNDLWRYDLTLNRWFWVSGASVPNQSSVFGTILVASPANIIGSRMGAVSWAYNSGLWLFGGYDYSGNEWNDLWRFSILDTTCGACNIPPVALFTAPHNICPGTCTDFTNQSVGATTFQWTFPGATPSTSAAINPVSICYNSPGSYDVVLIATNAITSDTLALNNYISVYPYPPPQGIVQSGDTLFANAGAVSYQWYRDGLLVPGATDYYYIAVESGDYNIVATDGNGCEVEAAIFDVIAGIQAAVGSGSPQLEIYPNPVEDKLIIQDAQFTPDSYRDEAATKISIYNLIGERIYLAVDCLPIAIGMSTVDCRPLSPGIYWLEINYQEKTYRTKFVKN